MTKRHLNLKIKKKNFKYHSSTWNLIYDIISTVSTHLSHIYIFWVVKHQFNGPSTALYALYMSKCQLVWMWILLFAMLLLLKKYITSGTT